MNTLSRNEKIAVAVALVVVALFFAFNASGIFMNNEENATSTGSALAPVTITEGLVAEDLVIGNGEEAQAGKLLTVHYTGILENGTVFDSSVQKGTPIQFVLGTGQVIPGWDQGFKGMKVGGTRRLTIAPELGYGNQEIPGLIPANSTLIFEMQLLGVDDVQ